MPLGVAPARLATMRSAIGCAASARRGALAVLCTLCLPVATVAIELDPLWDFSRPDISEQRFRDAQRGATADDRRILATQIARSYGIRRDFERARAALADLAPEIDRASAEVRVRYFLELGRTYVSAVHPAASRTPEAVAQGRFLFMKAHDLAVQAKLDALAVDALHMMAFVDNAPADQIAWNERALALVSASTQPAAKNWEPSLRHNLGYARHQRGEYDEALRQFQLGREMLVRAGRDRAVRIADWMIAWTYRAQKRYDEAIAVQHDLERRWHAAGEADRYVFEELELLYRAVGNEAEAARYGVLAKSRSQ